ncbi:glucose-6-phosphate dehydrogenase, partial [Fischerella thermalis CCMEE 5196]
MVSLLENPLRVGLQQQGMAEPQIIVIFGASGDLTWRKLVPSLYKLRRERRIPPETTIVGVARRDWTHEYFREQMRKGMEEVHGGVGSEELWQDFSKGLFYCSGN